MLDRRKISLLHVAKARLGLGDEDWRLMLLRVAGVESSTQLDDERFAWVTEHLQRAGFTSDFAARNFTNRTGMASPGQVALIRKLWAEYTDGAGDDASLGKWLTRNQHVSSLRFLDIMKARKAIGALNVMLKRKAAKTATAAS
jgi:hypothetical protein